MRAFTFQIMFSGLFFLFVAPILMAQGVIGAPLVLAHYVSKMSLFGAHRQLT